MIERFEAQLVAGIRCIRYEFTQKNFPIAVEAVDHQVKQLLHFSLEAHRLGFRFNLAHGSLVDDGSMKVTPEQLPDVDGGNGGH